MVKVEPLGHTSFKISGGGVGVIVNPFYKKATGLEWKKRAADLVLITNDSNAYNNADGVEGTPYVVTGPGEYEVKGVHVYGISSGETTLYQFRIDDISFLHLGVLNNLLGEDQLSPISETDVLFVPVGGVGAIDPEKAAEVAVKVGPRIVIPMYYQQDTTALSGLAPVEKFIEEMGKQVEYVLGLKLKSRDDLPEEMEVIVLGDYDS